MNTLSRRGMRLALMTVGFIGLFVAVNAVPGAATAPSSGFVSIRLGHGTLSHGSLSVKPGLQIVVVQNTVQPGGSSGWHSHPGGAMVVIQEGQITTYQSVKNDDEEEGGKAGSSRCVITTYTAGQAFVERPGDPIIAVNNGSSVTTSYATFPGVPVDPVTGNTLQRTDQPKPNPDPCPV
jgi:quercetin dioxygenase-like cupin family protein